MPKSPCGAHVAALVQFVYAPKVIANKLDVPRHKVMSWAEGLSVMTQDQANKIHAELLWSEESVDPAVWFRPATAASKPVTQYKPIWRIHPEQRKAYVDALQDLKNAIRAQPGGTTDEKCAALAQKIAPTNRNKNAVAQWYGRHDTPMFAMLPTPTHVLGIVEQNLLPAPKYSQDVNDLQTHPLLPESIYYRDGQHRSHPGNTVKSAADLIAIHNHKQVRTNRVHKHNQLPDQKYRTPIPFNGMDLGLVSRISAETTLVYTTHLWHVARSFGYKHAYKGIACPDGARLDMSHFHHPWPVLSTRNDEVTRAIAAATRMSQHDVVRCFTLQDVFTPRQAEDLAHVCAGLGRPFDMRALYDPGHDELRPLAEPHLRDLQAALDPAVRFWIDDYVNHNDPWAPPHIVEIVRSMTGKGMTTDPTDDEPEIDPVQAEFPEMEFDDDD